MSIRAKLEWAFAQLLMAAGAAGVEGAPQLLRSHEEQAVIKSGNQRIILRAAGGQQVTPRTRNLRMLLLVTVETNADRGAETEADPRALQSMLVDAAHAALDDEPDLAGRLSAMRSVVGSFTCFGVLPQGEIENPPAAEERMFRDVWGYQCTVAESDSD